MRKRILELLSSLFSHLKGKIRYVIFIIICIFLYLGWRYVEKHILIDIPSEVVGYCKEKYGGEYRWVGFDSEESGTMSRMSIVSDGSVEFHVERYYTLDSDEVFYRDDYLSHKYEEELNNMLLRFLPENSRGSILVEETTLGGTELGSISVGDLLKSKDTTLVMSVSTDHLWNLEEARSFSENFSCSLSVYLYAGGKTSHFISMDGDVVFR